MQDRFDLITPPSKIGNTSMGLIGLVYLYISVLKVTFVHPLGLILLENHGPRGTRWKKLQNLDSIDLDSI
jgi:hypothetical protein